MTIGHRARMTALLSATALLAGAMMITKTSHSTEGTQGFDATGVNQVNIHGDGSRVEVTASSSSQPGVTVFESGRLCGLEVDVSRAGDVVDIAIRQTGVTVWGQCDHRVAIAVPESISASIDQPKSVAAIEGVFANIVITSPMATVHFSGGAENLQIDTDKAVVKAEFTDGTMPRTVRIEGHELVADVGFPLDTRLEYDLNASISVFNSAFGNTPGADTKVNFDGRIMRATLYSLS
jgi:hypothetical protein